ncbi:MAG: AarF/ABC1/UbiB kinase family protein, partial [Propionibacteriaceae bacterium]|nr:AarF/ABC1/UbiB kinase family protein [Propionibacteriaceae bacterium]
MTTARTARFIRTFALALRFVVELWWLQRLRPLRGKRQTAAAARLFTRQAHQFVAFAMDMGGLIIKVGQFFSVRIDLLPKEYIDVLLTLQ